MGDQMNRREFVKRSAVAACVATSLALTSKEVKAEVTNAVDENDPMAKALGYKHDAASVDTATYPKRAGAEGAKQFCSNCMLFAQGGLKVAGKDGEWGKCTVIASGLVSAKGWCNSWVLKPGA